MVEDPIGLIEPSFIRCRFTQQLCGARKIASGLTTAEEVLKAARPGAEVD